MTTCNLTLGLYINQPKHVSLSASAVHYDGSTKQVLFALSSLFTECVKMDSTTDEIR